MTGTRGEMKFFRTGRDMRKTVYSVVCLIVLGLTFSGCASGGAGEWREFKIYCGMSSRAGDVSEEAWREFCDKQVSAAFPDGYTVLDSTGYWRSGPDTSASERSKVILIAAPAEAREKVMALAERYREQFHQDSVLITCSETEAVFVQEK